MTQRRAGKFHSGRKRLWGAAGLAAVAACAVFGLATARPIGAQSPPAPAEAPLSFEVASIKANRTGGNGVDIEFRPGRFTASGASAKQLIALAYDVRDFQISDRPGWISIDRYDIDARMPEGLWEEMVKLPHDQARPKMQLLLQSLLADRFQLKVSRATKELPIYALVIARNGPRIQEAKADDTYPNGFKGPDGRPIGHGGGMKMHGNVLTGQGVPLSNLAQALSRQLERMVVDQTGLKGNYDFTLKWAPDPSSAAMVQGPPGGGAVPSNEPPPDSSGPSIFTAVQEQLGLKLDSTKGPVEVLIIDHIERPSEN